MHVRPGTRAHSQGPAGRSWTVLCWGGFPDQGCRFLRASRQEGLPSRSGPGGCGQPRELSLPLSTPLPSLSGCKRICETQTYCPSQVLLAATTLILAEFSQSLTHLGAKSKARLSRQQQQLVLIKRYGPGICSKPFPGILP